MSTDGTTNQRATSDAATSKFTMKRWLIWASSIATILVVIYTVFHCTHYKSHGEKTHRLSTTEYAAITSFVQEDTSNCKESAEARVKVYLDDIMVLKNKASVDKMIEDQGVQSTTYLSNYPFKVRSYFWLSDYWVLLEVIFWSLFGLVANLMYSVTRTREVDSDGDGKNDKPEVFNPNRVPEHIGKFWYTPLTSVVIYLSIDYLTTSGEINETPEGAYVVVFAFILGFFSRRTIGLLRKLKDIFFPNDNSGSSGDSDNSSQNQEPPAPTYTSVTLSGTVETAPSLSLDSVVGTVINIYSSSDPSTAVATQTLPEGSAGSFTFNQPFTPGEYTYDASLTSGGKEYTDNGDLTIANTSETQSLTITLAGSEG